MTKITLATLHLATAQEVADQVVNHLLDQNEESISGAACKYRSGKLMCAAGCLIGDDEYKEDFEYQNWPNLVRTFNLSENHCQLIRDFQRIHDDCSVEDWEWKIKDTLEDHSLQFNRVVV